MPIQHFWTAPSAIEFPQGTWATGILYSMLQLKKLFYHSPAQKLVGIFIHTATEQNHRNAFGLLWRLVYMWRDGTVVDVLDVPLNLHFSHDIDCSITSDGRVIRGADDASNKANDELSAAVSGAMFPITSRWANDILTNDQVASVAVVSSSPNASIVFADGTAWTISQPSTAGANFQIVERPAGTVLFADTGSTWRHSRDLIFIDFQRAAVTFMRSSSGSQVDADGQPSLIRLFDTTSNPWTHLWTDELPASDTRACFDPANEVLYSCGRNPNSAVIHASRLRQSPVSLTAITLVEGSALRSQEAKSLSVTILDGLGAGISNAVVRWNLVSSISGGKLNSAYSLTNDNGAASITYIGPFMSQASSTETVSAEVAEIWPKGLV